MIVPLHVLQHCFYTEQYFLPCVDHNAPSKPYDMYAYKETRYSYIVQRSNNKAVRRDGSQASCNVGCCLVLQYNCWYVNYYNYTETENFGTKMFVKN